MAIVFPASPSNNDTFTVGSITYTYDGSKWIGLGVTPTDRLLEGSNSLEITAGNELIWTGGKVGVNQVTPIAIFHAKSGANDGSLVSTFEGSTNNKLNIRFDAFGPVLDVTAGDPLAFEIGGSEKLRIDSSGRLLVGKQSHTGDALFVAESNHTSGGIIGEFDNAATGNFGGVRILGGVTDRECRLQSLYGSSFFTFYTEGTGAAEERLRIDSAGLITQGGKTASNHGSPNLLLWGADTTLHISSTESVNNSSSVGIKFAVAGGSTGDYSKAGIFVQRQDSYNDLDMIFAFRSSNDAAGVAISDEKLRINSDGKLLVNTTSVNESNAKLYVNGQTNSSNVVIGRVHDSINSNNRTILLQRIVANQGFQFSGKIIINSYTGSAMVDCVITVMHTNQNIEIDVVNATHSAQTGKSNLRVVTADYGSDRYLGIQKNGGGTGVAYLNAFVSGNIDNTGSGGIREVNNSSLGSVTIEGNLN